MTSMPVQVFSKSDQRQRDAVMSYDKT